MYALIMALRTMSESSFFTSWGGICGGHVCEHVVHVQHVTLVMINMYMMPHMMLLA